MNLGDKRRTFTHNVAMLILYAETLGYKLAVGNTTGKTSLKTSLHPLGLAADMHLYKQDSKGRWIYQRASKAHKPLGDFWKTLHPLNRWGGDFPGDGNHYSMEHQGRK